MIIIQSQITLFRPSTHSQAYRTFYTRLTKARGYWFRYIGEQMEIQVPVEDEADFKEAMHNGKFRPADFKLDIIP